MCREHKHNEETGAVEEKPWAIANTHLKKYVRTNLANSTLRNTQIFYDFLKNEHPTAEQKVAVYGELKAQLNLPKEEDPQEK